MDGDALDNIPGGAARGKGGHIVVNFYGSNEVASIKDSPECLRPFNSGKIDAVIAKHKKKRNAKAIAIAKEEELTIRLTRSKACRFYAEQAWRLVSTKCGNSLTLGRRVQIFRSDLNYPYGDTIVGTIRRMYCNPHALSGSSGSNSANHSNKKWLLSYEISEKTKKKYDSSWVNLNAKECHVKFLDKSKFSGNKLPKDLKDEDLVPFLHGYEVTDVAGSSPGAATCSGSISEGEARIGRLLKERCRGCVDYLKPGQAKVVCKECKGSYHIGCTDEAAYTKGNRLDFGHDWTCSKCKICESCSSQDICFGTQPYMPVVDGSGSGTVTPLDLCSKCIKMYADKQYCPNCVHFWDDQRYNRVSQRPKTSIFKSLGRSRNVDSSATDDDDEIEMHPSEEVQADWYYEDTEVWGYTPGHMLGCDGCSVWVHAGCANLTRTEYETTSSGFHPIYSKEFLCKRCCFKRSMSIFDALQKEDKMMLFAAPVTPEMAPTYHDIIKNPMDLQTMAKKLREQERLNYAWIREDFELMVFNALTFSSIHHIPNFGRKPEDTTPTA